MHDSLPPAQPVLLVSAFHDGNAEFGRVDIAGVVDTEGAGDEGHLPVAATQLPCEGNGRQQRWNVVGLQRIPGAVDLAAPVEAFARDEAVRGLPERQQGGQPASHLFAARAGPELVDRRPELVVGRHAFGGVADLKQHRQQIVEIQPQVTKMLTEGRSPLVKLTPIAWRTLQPNERDMTQGLDRVVVVRAGSVHERHQRRHALELRRRTEVRHEQRHDFVANKYQQRFLELVEHSQPVVVSQVVPHPEGGLLAHKRSKKMSVLARVQLDVRGHLVDNSLPDGVRAQPERLVRGETRVCRLHQQAGRRHRVRLVVRLAVTEAVVDSIRQTEPLVAEVQHLALPDRARKERVRGEIDDTGVGFAPQP